MSHRGCSTRKEKSAAQHGASLCPTKELAVGRECADERVGISALAHGTWRARKELLGEWA